MAANDRESTFTIKAADLSTQQINQVISTVERLIAVQEKQNEAAAKGAVKTNDFNKSLKDLAGTGADAVARQITALQRYAAVSEEVQRRQDVLAKLQADRAALADKGDLSRSEKAQANRLDKQIENAEKMLARQNAAFAKSEEAMKGMGSSVETLGADLERLRGFAQRVQVAIDAASVAQLHLTENQLKAAAAAAEEADKQEKLAKAIKDAADAEKARTKQREADLDAQQRQYNFERQANALALKDADERLAKEKALAEIRERVAAQRDLTAQALGRLPAISPLGQPAVPLQDYSKVNRELSGLVDPASAARQTIDGLTVAIDKLLNSIESGTRKPKDLANDIRELGNAAQDLKKLGGMIDAFQAQEAAVRKADEAVKEIERDMAALAAKGQRLTEVDKEYAAQVKAVEAEARRRIEALERENGEYTRQAAILERAGVNHKHLDEDVSRLRASAAGMGKVFTQAAEAAAGKSGTVFLGLRPYELQNLSYQINDIFTQIGSGTPITQVFAQQGGQVFQLFQHQLLDFLKTLREIPGGLAIAGAGLAALGVAFAALGRAIEVVSAKRLFAADIAASVDGATHSVGELIDAAKEVEKLGIGIGESLKGVRELSNLGVPTAQLTAAATLAGNISRAFGKPFADASKEVGKAITGSYEAMRQFTAGYKFLTFEEDRQIKALYDNNRAEEARALALEFTGKKAKEAVDAGLSPLQKATIALQNNWTKLLESVGAEEAWTKLLGFLASTAKELNLIATLTGKVGGAFSWLNDWVMNHRGVEAALDRAEALKDRESGGGPGTQAPGTSRGDRNNNPGNLEFRDQTGAVREGGSGRFAKFADQESGVAAALHQYLLYQDRDKLTTIQQMVEKATPPKSKGGDNPDAVVQRYMEAVAKELGVKVTDAINLHDKDTAVKYIQAVARQEGNTPPTAAVAQAGVGRVLGRATEESKINTANYQEDQDRQYRARRRSQATAEELDRFEKEEIEDARQKASKEAQKAGPPGAEIDKVQVELNTQREIDRIQEEYKLIRQRRAEEVLKFDQGIRQQELAADRTNLDKRLQLLNEHYDAEQADLQKRRDANAVTPEQFAASSAGIARARQFAANKEAEDTAKAILDDAETKRNNRFTQLENELRAQQITGAAANARTQALVAETRPEIADAVKRLNAALATRQGPETAETRLLRERGATALSTADRPPQVDTIQTAAIARAQKDVADIVSERESGVKAIVEKEKSGAISMRDAVTALRKLLDDTAPRMRESIERANAELRTIAAAPGTTPSRKADIAAQIAANDAKLVAQRTEFINQVIESGLHDAIEERDRLIKERDSKIADILKRPGLAPDEMNRQLTEVARASNAEIEAAKKRLIQLYRDAMNLPNLTPGQRANLQTGIAETEAVQTTGIEQQRQGITGPGGTLTQLQQSRASITETQQAVKSRLATGTITAEEGEDKIKKAFEDANKSGQPLLRTLNDQINALEAMGEKASVIENLRAKADELAASFKYVSDFQRAFIKTLEDSLANRGMQAIDTIAQSLGKAIAGMESWKDVISDIGKAFADFAAGVLKDLASMIIKMYLYKLVQSTIGGMAGVPVMHSGGVVGAVGGARRDVDMSLFMFARRMHNGGAVGFANDEVPMILQRGEGVLSKAEMAQRANGGGGGGGSQTGIRNVLAVGDREIAGAMNGAHGEKVILNVLQRNAPTVKKMVG